MAQPTFWHPPERGWAEHDLGALPADGYRYEIIDGGLHMTPPAGFEHHELADEVRMALRAAAPAGWRVIREAGVRVPGGNLIPDVTVLRPGAPRSGMWLDAEHVALVVEVESASSRRHDRFTKPALYAEAGIEAYWRIEQGDFGPVLHLYELVKGDSYALIRTLGPDDRATVPQPFPVEVHPARWRLSEGW
ncbi:Uma2 family endonuclease [Plantactinospora sp. GCM10030261]|uniref:Uma2 family endonuclease n=1 Tax=Plantactinospora sp. GCM10030261 TaxID=3273420 RepID=UPI0036062310